MLTSLQTTTGQSSPGESASESGKFIVETETSPLIQGRQSRYVVSDFQWQPFWLGSDLLRPRQSTRLTGYVRRVKPGFTTRNIQLHLINDGNVARDHLASERTFLAYVRTSLGIAATGVGMAKFYSASDRLSSVLPRSSDAISSSWKHIKVRHWDSGSDNGVFGRHGAAYWWVSLSAISCLLRALTCGRYDPLFRCPIRTSKWGFSCHQAWDSPDRSHNRVRHCCHPGHSRSWVVTPLIFYPCLMKIIFCGPSPFLASGTIFWRDALQVCLFGKFGLSIGLIVMPPESSRGFRYRHTWATTCVPSCQNSCRIFLDQRQVTTLTRRKNY